MKPGKNKMQLGLALIGLGFGLTHTAYAQHGVGNGGDAVVCPGSVRLLDSVETEKRFRPMKFSITSETTRSRVAEVIERLKKIDINLGNEINRRAQVLITDIMEFQRTGNSYQTNTEFGEGELPNVSDEGALFAPVGCELKQLVVRTPNPLPNQKEYSIRLDLWSLMNGEEKAATILHEAIYGYLVDSKVNSSASARWLNGLALSDTIKDKSSKEMYEDMKKFGFPMTAWVKEAFGIIYTADFGMYEPIGDNYFDRQGNQYRADGTILMISTGKFALSRHIKFFNGFIQAGTAIKLSPEGAILKMNINNGSLPGQMLLDISTKTLLPSMDEMIFHERPSGRYWDVISKKDNRLIKDINFVTLANASLEVTETGMILKAVHKKWRFSLLRHYEGRWYNAVTTQDTKLYFDKEMNFQRVEWLEKEHSPLRDKF